MTRVERLARPTRCASAQGRRTRWTLTLLVVAAVSSSTLTLSSKPAAASTLSLDKARAANLYGQVQRIDAQVAFLGQKYDLAHLRLAQIHSEIANTRQIVASIESRVAKNNAQLRADAVYAYITNGAAAAANPLFSTNAVNIGSTNVYTQLAEGDVGTVIANLKTSKIQLTQERTVLNSQVSAAQVQSNQAAAALHQAQVLQYSINTALSQVKGAIANYYNQIQAAQVAQAAHVLSVAQSSHAVSTQVPTGSTPSGGSQSAPPPDPLGQAAVNAAESFLGTWYCWGGASRSCVDCSGLVMLSYDMVGVGLPHYSGAQFADTTPVPTWDIQPGDLLFYGPQGDDHVAMYVGGGNMIEAPYTGAKVHITPVRFGYGFVGIGRVNA